MSGIHDRSTAMSPGLGVRVRIVIRRLTIWEVLESKQQTVGDGGRALMSSHHLPEYRMATKPRCNRHLSTREPPTKQRSTKPLLTKMMLLVDLVYPLRPKFYDGSKENKVAAVGAPRVAQVGTKATTRNRQRRGPPEAAAETMMRM